MNSDRLARLPQFSETFTALQINTTNEQGQLTDARNAVLLPSTVPQALVEAFDDEDAAYQRIHEAKKLRACFCGKPGRTQCPKCALWYCGVKC